MPLQQRTREGYSVLFGKLLDTDASKYNFNDHIRDICMCIDVAQYEIGTTPGQIVVFDTVGATLGHIARLDLAGQKKFLMYIQDGLPIRLKGVHIMNSNSIMEVALNMIKPFMKKELMDIVS